MPRENFYFGSNAIELDFQGKDDFEKTIDTGITNYYNDNGDKVAEFYESDFDGSTSLKVYEYSESGCVDRITDYSSSLSEDMERYVSVSSSTFDKIDDQTVVERTETSVSIDGEERFSGTEVAYYVSDGDDCYKMDQEQYEKYLETGELSSEDIVYDLDTIEMVDTIIEDTDISDRDVDSPDSPDSPDTPEPDPDDADNPEPDPDDYCDSEDSSGD